MKNSEELIKELLARRDEYELRRRQRRKRVVGASVSAGCCALLLCAVFLLPGMKDGIGSAALPAPTDAPLHGGEANQPDVPQTDAGAAVPETSKPVSDAGGETDAGLPDGVAPPKPVTDDAAVSTGSGGALTADPIPATGTAGSGTYDICYFRWRNRLSLAGSLYWAIEDDPDGTFAVVASYRPVTGEITDFTYEGKTLSEWAVASADARFLPIKMQELLKLGDALKYGEALCETGTPDGEIWDRRLYADQLAYYGEELLSRYIVDGEFLREALEKDLAEADSTVVRPAEEAYARAYAAYMDEVLPEIAAELTEQGFSCQRAADRADALLLTVTAEELENLPLDDAGSWRFSLL